MADPLAIDPAVILATPMSENDSGADTIGGYLVALAEAVWKEEEGFSGKRPFGNSGWKAEVYLALAEADLIDCERDSDGDIIDFDEVTGDARIEAAFTYMKESL